LHAWFAAVLLVAPVFIKECLQEAGPSYRPEVKRTKLQVVDVNAEAVRRVCSIEALLASSEDTTIKEKFPEASQSRPDVRKPKQQPSTKTYKSCDATKRGFRMYQRKKTTWGAPDEERQVTADDMIEVHAMITHSASSLLN